jgi:hypothetical protein
MLAFVVAIAFDLTVQRVGHMRERVPKTSGHNAMGHRPKVPFGDQATNTSNGRCLADSSHLLTHCFR